MKLRRNRRLSHLPVVLVPSSLSPSLSLLPLPYFAPPLITVFLTIAGKEVPTEVPGLTYRINYISPSEEGTPSLRPRPPLTLTLPLTPTSRTR